MIFKVIIKTDIIDSPKEHEIRAALIVANKYFKSDVIFLRQETYSTPDISVTGKMWEIKSPRGGSKKTIENNLRNARKQSKNIVVDFSLMKLHQTKAISNIKFFIKNDSGRIEKLIVITKDKKILEIL
jgi:glucan biosynthesis protein